MQEKLIEYLSQYIDISSELEKALRENLQVKEYPRGTILLKAGETCRECYFILSGLIRSFCLKEGEEVTVDFFMEEQSVTPFCYGKEIPSEISLECLEDTVAVIGLPQVEEDMYSRYPELETMARIIAEKMMSDYKESFDDFKMSTPEERYLSLVENNPALIQRAPQYQIASYLGIKPESLSRIRKRISQKR